MEIQEDRELGLSFVKIGPHRYAVQKFHSMQAFDYGLKFIAAFGPKLPELFGAIKEGGDHFRIYSILADMLDCQRSSDLFKEAVGQCFTPENESLADLGIHNRWFNKHPQDMFELAVLALWALLKDFFSARTSTLLAEWQKEITPQWGEQMGSPG